jgi:hypothetical protein
MSLLWPRSNRDCPNGLLRCRSNGAATVDSENININPFFFCTLPACQITPDLDCSCDWTTIIIVDATCPGYENSPSPTVISRPSFFSSFVLCSTLLLPYRSQDLRFNSKEFKIHCSVSAPALGQNRKKSFLPPSSFKEEQSTTRELQGNSRIYSADASWPHHLQTCRAASNFPLIVVVGAAVNIRNQTDPSFDRTHIYPRCD